MGVLLITALVATTAPTGAASAPPSPPPATVPPPLGIAHNNDNNSNKAEKAAMRVTGGSFVFPPEAAFPPPAPTSRTSPSDSATTSSTSKARGGAYNAGSTTRRIMSNIKQPAQRALRPLIVSSVAGAAATGGWYRDDNDSEGGVSIAPPESLGVTNDQTAPPSPPSTTAITQTPPPTSTAASTYTSSSSSITKTSSPLSPTKQISSQRSLSPEAIMYMSLLALQFGLQPILVRRFTPQNICRSSVVMVQEMVKFLIGFGIYFSDIGGVAAKEKRSKELNSWNVKTWLALAGLPAALYTVQNMASLLAYQNLEALTFNVLNQTKILSAALCCFLVMGKKQSKMQMASLLMLLSSALIIEKIVTLDSFAKLLFVGGGAGGSGLIEVIKGTFMSLRHMSFSRHVTHGVIPVLLASFISGLAGALTQKNLQGATKSGEKKEPRNAYLFSMEMNVASVIILVASMFFTADGKKIISSGFFHNWTPQTLIPVLTNSIGGIIVGLVTKHAGSVRKGFALIFGLLLSGIIQAGSVGIAKEHMIGGAVAAISLWLHTSNPHKPVQQRQQEQRRRVAMATA